MVDDKLFYFIVSRVQNREAVSLAISAVTSSASLILLALYFNQDHFLSFIAIVLGILFPLLGLAHIEITFQYIHRHDLKWIRKLVSEESKHVKKSRAIEETEEILVYTKSRILRLILLRILLLLPVMGWFFVLDYELNLGYFLGIYFTLISIGFFTVRYSRNDIEQIQK